MNNAQALSYFIILSINVYNVSIDFMKLTLQRGKLKKKH